MSVKKAELFLREKNQVGRLPTLTADFRSGMKWWKKVNETNVK